MKRSPFIVLAACALLCLNACVKNETSKSNAKNIKQLEDNAILTVLGNLTGQSTLNFADKSYQATYGTVLDESNPGERSIKVQSEAFSKNSFLSIAGFSSLIEETSDGMVLDLTGRKFGKLTFHEGSGTNSGYVDVDIRCIPGLNRISFKTKDQWGLNDGEKSIFTYGEVLRDPQNGYHYLVIYEPSMHLPGLMISVQPGRGDDITYCRAEDEWGPWLPNNNFSMFYDDYFILRNNSNEFVISCFDAYNIVCMKEKELKSQIIEATGRNVFPDVALFNGESEFITNAYEGFATMRDGYSHYVGENNVKGIRIFYNYQREEDYNMNIVDFACLDADSRNEFVWTDWALYQNEGDFKKVFYDGCTMVIYTVYVKPFTNRLYPDFEKVFTPSPVQ